LKSGKRKRNSPPSQDHGDESDKENINTLGGLGDTFAQRGRKKLRRRHTTDFNQEVLDILERDFNRRAIHEDRVEKMVEKTLEETQKTRREVQLFIENQHH
jgi:hypothetical protein